MNQTRKPVVEKWESFSVPTVRQPHDLPDLRKWLVARWRPGTALGDVFGDAGWVRPMLATAHLWWVEEETCHLVAEAAPTLPADFCLDMDDLPAMSGFAVFEHDLVGTDAGPPDIAGFDPGPLTALAGREIRIAAISWSPIALLIDGKPYHGIGIGSWSRHHLDDGLSPDDMARTSPTLNAVIRDTVADPNPRQTTGFVAKGSLFTYLGRTDWLPGAGPDAPLPGEEAADVHKLVSKAEDRRLLGALWALSKAPVVTTVRTKPPRPAARRSERAGLNADVRILRLGGPSRRENIVTADGAGRDWKHQWVVGPHFRWQAHGRGWSQRKLIVVGPYTKGPADKPLLGAERVWRVVPPK